MGLRRAEGHGLGRVEGVSAELEHVPHGRGGLRVEVQRCHQHPDGFCSPNKFHLGFELFYTQDPPLMQPK